MGKLKNKSGITLIALVVTIVVLLIIAGVAINLAIGENGLFNQSKLAAEKYEEARQKEENELEKAYQYMIGEVPDEPVQPNTLPENNESIEAGTQVELEKGWYTETPVTVQTSDGAIITSSTKVATVNAVSTGAGETVPVPKGFYYVGGKVATGVVISDDSRDQNKYAGVVDVPAGAVYNTDGTVVTYTEEQYNSLSAEEKNNVILGNQFVWIPCTDTNYAKYNFGKTNTNGWDTNTPGSELMQISKYGGFYIGRYEAGTSNITMSSGVAFDTASGVPNGNWLNNNFRSNYATGKITTKAGEIPYYHADYNTAQAMSNAMYKTNYVQSGLVTGTMWDVAMKFISTDDTNYSDVKDSPFGNYSYSAKNYTLTYTQGRGRYLEVNSSTGAVTSNAKTSEDGVYHYGIRTSAFSEGTKKNNIYDLAGNLWEWTDEDAYIANGNEGPYCMLRGGGFGNSYSDVPVCFRVCNTAAYTSTANGFRPALFIR